MNTNNQKMVMRFSELAFNELRSTVGTLPPESGGLLLGYRDDFIVRKFVFDPFGRTSGGAYDPDIQSLNALLKKEKEENGFVFLGMGHSHPRGLSTPSHDYGKGLGDLGYAKRIFSSFKSLDRFLMPIVHSSHQGEFRFFPYIALRENISNYAVANLEIVSLKKQEQICNDLQGYSFNPSKLTGSVDYELMQNAHVVCVGIGGANGICENLIRTGLGNITVIEFDKVEQNNLVTQGYYVTDIGKYKVDALKERITNINPRIKFNGVNADFTKLSKSHLQEIIQGKDLLLMMTDDFHAQAFGNRVALKYKVPTIFAMMYEKARCSEITFNIPGITPACHRCATKSRYKAYENGFVNNVTSTGSTIFQTEYLNSAIGMLLLAIIHRFTTGFEFSNWFGKSFNRNLVQLRNHPNYSNQQNSLFHRIYAGIDKVFNFDSIWQTVNEDGLHNCEEPCPDCGGFGDLGLSSKVIPLLQNEHFRKSKWLHANDI